AHAVAAGLAGGAAVGGAAAEPGRVCDLGAGGGVPGLVVALDHPSVSITLLDRSERCCAFLDRAVDDLGLADRVEVLLADAADAAHEPDHRGAYDVVLSRSFGPPAATAECGAALLGTGGLLVVSEPPAVERSRWPPAPLAGLGLELERRVGPEPNFVVLRLVSPCPAGRPRPWAQIVKRPLY
ncbi:MAG TPA: hypothetical protein DEP66_03315, partial [Acidimicrobiaceae bacterium]|nr:hypothetical protein [Acidimicrobiaceae bacterium]